MRPFEYRKRTSHWGALGTTVAMLLLAAALFVPAAAAESIPAAAVEATEDAASVPAPSPGPAAEAPAPSPAPEPAAAAAETATESIGAAASTAVDGAASAARGVGATSPSTGSESPTSSLPTDSVSSVSSLAQDATSAVASVPEGSQSSASLAGRATPNVLPSGHLGSTGSAVVKRVSEPVRRVSTATAPVAANVKEVLDSVVSSAAANLPAPPPAPLGFDRPASFAAAPNFIPPGPAASSAPEAGGPLGVGSAPTPLAAAPSRTYLGLPAPLAPDPSLLAAARDALAGIGTADVLTAPAAGFDAGFPAGDRPAPGDPLPAPFEAPGAGAGSSGSFFVPLAALLALLALAAPASFRRRREAPGFLAPVPFVCALERPG